MEEYQEFVGKLQKRGSKPYKISHCLGTRDAWKWVRKNKWKMLGGKPCDQSLYSNVINTVNKKAIDLILEGHEIEVPCRVGSFYLTHVPAKVAVEDGKVKSNYRTDWLKTLQLWYEDIEARNTHRKVKRVQDVITFLYYDRTKANYTNMGFYIFRPNRSIVRIIGRTLENRKLNTRQFNISYDKIKIK
jgi:hypothetical protein